MAKAPKPKPAPRVLRLVSETKAVNDKTAASAKRVGRMTRPQRLNVIAAYQRRMEENAPSMEAADSDLLAVLQAVGMEFATRYYPDCGHALFTIGKYTPAGGPAYWVQIPIPVPGDESEKGGA